MARSDRYTRKILTSGDRSKWSDLYISDNNKKISEHKQAYKLQRRCV